jgi:hypothetical protein
VSAARTNHAPCRLVDILRALPSGELASLVARLGIRIDPAKRLDAPSQVARALVALPDLRDPSRLPQASVELLHRVAEARGSLVVATVPAALEPLSARGLMFARGERSKRVELVLPAAFLVQLRSWEGEDPSGIRALLAQASFETTSAIAANYLGRPATPPIALSLEIAWEALSDPLKLAEEIERLAPSERRVLDGVESQGGEVDTEELLELEREPLRLRTASGATPSRRGVGVSLERRGLLIPVHPNRHIVPTEVAIIVGAARRAESSARRTEVKSFVIEGDHSPRRARFAPDPSVLATALAITAREAGNDVRAGIGTPKSLVQKLAARFGREPQHVALLIALSRAIGLWDASAITASAPPGSLAMGELAQVLFRAWRRGGAWDEARTEPEVLRLSADARDSSPVGVVREIVIDALSDLSAESSTSRAGGWLPWASLAGYLSGDHRVPGLTRLLRRWAERVGADPIEPIEVAKRIVVESLHALGVLDLGEEDAAVATTEAAPEGPMSGAWTLRLTPRGRALVAGVEIGNTEETERTKSKFLDTHVLRLGSSSRLCAVLNIAPFVEVARATESVDLIVAPQTLARALSAGFEAEALRQRIEELAPLPESLSRILAQASIVLGRATFAAAGGFLWVEDPNIREMLRTRRATAELFVDPSPPGGLIVQANVDLDRVSRRCRTIGVEIVADGQVVKIRSMTPHRLTPTKGERTTPARGTDKSDK